MDRHLTQASALIVAAGEASASVPLVKSYFDESTNTVSHLVYDPATRDAAIIDSVLNFDPAGGRVSFTSADALIAHVRAEALRVVWLLETHVHADHLSAAPYLQANLGGKIAICREIVHVQQLFSGIFNEGHEFACDGSEFDHLFDDGDCFTIGGIQAMALHVPGHTRSDLAYVIGDAVFTGDTLFMPDYGTARADFPGGSSRQLFRSIQRLLSLPDETRLFLCHDYKAPGRQHFAWETNVRAERIGNVHVHAGVGEDDFVAMRDARDATLPMPKLILPSIQVNMHAGRLPMPQANGTRYLKLPLNAL